jgi:hypothetical protein
MPPLRPDAPPPHTSRSSTATSHAGSLCLSAIAVHSPTKPPPRMATSARAVPRRAGDAHSRRGPRGADGAARGPQRRPPRRLHKQTLVYRIKRVEELTGRRLDDTGDVAQLWLALRSLELTGQRRR